jgi:tetratricopeptide (TPR) repeat protein
MEEHGERLLVLSRELNDQGGIAFGLRVRAKSALLRGEDETALRHYAESLALLRQAGNPVTVATCLMTIGDTYTFYSRDFDAAQRYYEESLANFERKGYARGIARASSRLALLMGHRGDIAESRALYDKAMQIPREYGEKAGIARVHLGLGESDIKENNLSSARGNLNESLHLFSAQGVNDRIPDVLLRLAFLDSKEERWERAIRLLGAQQTPKNALRVPGNEFYHQFITDAAKVAMGEGVFKAERAIGLNMSFDEAVEYASASVG